MSGKRAREQDGTLAALVFLSRVLDDLGLPVRLAERWVRPADLKAFIGEIDKQIGALVGTIDGYLEKHPGLLQQGSDPEAAWIVEQELAAARKNLDFLSRIGRRGAKKDAGKSNPEIAREVIRRVIAGSGSAPDFSAEAEKVTGCGSAPDFAAEREELRRLRGGELKIEPPSDSKGPQR